MMEDAGCAPKLVLRCRKEVRLLTRSRLRTRPAGLFVGTGGNRAGTVKARINGRPKAVEGRRTPGRFARTGTPDNRGGVLDRAGPRAFCPPDNPAASAGAPLFLLLNSVFLLLDWFRFRLAHRVSVCDNSAAGASK